MTGNAPGGGRDFSCERWPALPASLPKRLGPEHRYRAQYRRAPAVSSYRRVAEAVLVTVVIVEGASENLFGPEHRSCPKTRPERSSHRRAERRRHVRRKWYPDVPAGAGQPMVALPAGATGTPEAWRRDPALVWVVSVAHGLGARRAAECSTSRAGGSRLDARLARRRAERRRPARARGQPWCDGGLFAHRCFACAPAYENVDIPEAGSAPLRVEPPRCTHCGGRIRPGVVWFDEGLPRAAYRTTERAATECDVMLVVGTSGLMHPAAGLPAIAKDTGAALVEINPLTTELSQLMDACVRHGAAVASPRLFD